jgi:hypothetical protein
MLHGSKVTTPLETHGDNRVILRPRRPMRTPLLVALALLALAACNRKPDEPGEPRAAAPESKSAASPALPAPNTDTRAPAPAGSAREIVWTDPPGWQKIPSASAMRKATYKVPAAAKDTDDAEVAVFYFRGEGGSTEANIQRWIGQFSDVKPADVKRSQRSVGGMNQTIVEVEGTYASGMPGGAPSAATPKAQYRLIGAVVETAAGPYFFKMTGPKKTVEAARAAFFTMLDSVKPS